MIKGTILIGSDEQRGDATFQAIDPSTTASFGPDFAIAGAEHVALACSRADAAAIAYGETAPEKRAAFLEAIGTAIMEIGDPLIACAMRETGLPRARLEGERGRTISQLGMFAQLLRDGGHADIAIDPALPDRQPLPRPDLRRMNVPLGPVAVFGASNFPLAFSVAGGDTASALAAGCPVIVKGHPSHPGTGELVARAILAAARAHDMPDGVFSYLPGLVDTGAALVSDPHIRAVGFTGSRAGGLALMAAAANRPEPIPVYAEMSAVNPVILMPAALANRAEEIGAGFVQSLVMGAGQFCTNPGLVLAVKGSGLDRFLQSARTAIGESAPQTMLSPGIHASYDKGVAGLEAQAEVELVARGMAESGCNQARAGIFLTNAQMFMANEGLQQEIFGSASLVVEADDMDELQQVVERMEGQLTATLQLDAEDEAAAAPLVRMLQRKAGRILVNGWPTGVEVCSAMVHGGPFPATSDGRTTSVGTLAITRFLRPVCFQNFPQGLLPPQLADAQASS